MNRSTRSGRLMRVSSIVGSDRRVVAAQFDEDSSAPEILESPLRFGVIGARLLSDRDGRSGSEQTDRLPGADLVLGHRAGEREPIAGLEHDGQAMSLEDGFDSDPVVVADSL